MRPNGRKEGEAWGFVCTVGFCQQRGCPALYQHTPLHGPAPSYRLYVRTIASMCNRYTAPNELDVECFWPVDARHSPKLWQPSVYSRALGSLIRRDGYAVGYCRELVVGQSALIPWFAKESSCRTAPTMPGPKRLRRSPVTSMPRPGASAASFRRKSSLSLAGSPAAICGGTSGAVMAELGG